MIAAAPGRAKCLGGLRTGSLFGAGRSSSRSPSAVSDEAVTVASGTWGKLEEWAEEEAQVHEVGLR